MAEVGIDHNEATEEKAIAETDDVALTKAKKQEEEAKFDIASKLVFGASSLAGMYQPISEDEIEDVIGAAVEAGIRDFDTAPHYGCGLSEERLGMALRKYILKGQTHIVIKDRVGT